MVAPDNSPTRPRFELGHLVATPNALACLELSDILNAVSRHLRGDWGDVDEHDRAANNFALRRGERLFSVFHAASGTKFWVITEADRSSTTVLLPEDY